MSEGYEPFGNLAGQLTLFKPGGGGQIMPKHYILPASRIQKAIYISDQNGVF